MENSVILITCLSLAIYAYFISRYLLANFKVKNLLNTTESQISVAVIIPFRNEVNNIEPLTQSLFEQEYSNNLLEIIFVDDHSTDQSLTVLKARCKTSPFRCKILSLSTEVGKKAALKKGVEASVSNYIITSDADCTMKTKWVATMVSYFSNNKSMIIGPVRFKTGSSIFKDIQQTELSAILACTAGAVFINKPISCNGANLAYTRTLYDKIKPYELHTNIASGDDVFFLFEAKKILNPLKIGFASSALAVVKTSASNQLLPFIHQRVRWARKSRYFDDWESKKFGIVVFGINVLLLLIMIYSIFNHEVFWIFCSCFLLKLFVDYFLLLSTHQWNPVKNSFLNSILLSLIYPLYLLSIALLSLLLSNKWKGRNL